MLNRYAITVRISGHGFTPISITGTADAESIGSLLDDDVIKDSEIGGKLDELSKTVKKSDAQQADHLSFEVHKVGPAQRRVPKKRRG